MKSSLIYMYNMNKKQIVISLLSFIFVVAVAFVCMGNYIKKESGEINQTIIIVLVIFVYIIFVVTMFIQAMSAFGKMIESTLFRLTPTSGRKIVLAILLFAFIYLAIFELLGTIFLYSISIKLIKGTEMYEAFIGLTQKPFQQIVSSVLFVFNLVSLLLILLFVTASVKVFSLKKKIEYGVIFALFFTLSKAMSLIYATLGKLVPRGYFIDKLLYIDESFDDGVYLYPEKFMNLYSLSFSIGIFILLVYITGRIIDKKLEV
ncbi:ABC transporter permease [Bacillus sp. NP247]|uniref:ABC transporter permease n=1 Tax=Bacillus sp. NP247 TaxID=2846779 RepID=UPI001C6275A0|nr:ABC transporter permease [Bacillus sp. NP247]QWU44225.1 ABC transporter permease [Bacillus sp. NP247]